MQSTLSDNCLEVRLFISFPEENMATTKQKDACDFLDADHKAVKKMFTEYRELAEARGSSREKKRQLAEQICRELTVHTQLEDEIFYPAVRKAIKEDLMMDEAGVEHASAKELIGQLQSSSPGEDDHYDAKVKVLGEYIDHHVKEEEGEMFPKVKKSDLDLDALGEEIAARKDEILAELGVTAEA